MSGEMQKINPLIRVPSLILETGETLIDSSAIIDHLDEMAGPARALTPAHGPERRKVLQAVVLALGIDGEGGGAVLRAAVPHRQAHQPRLREAHAVSDPARRSTKLEHDCGAPWFFDDRMTQADITIGCMLGYMKMRVPDVFPADKFPKLHALALHCETKEDFVKARPSPDETVPGATRQLEQRRPPACLHLRFEAGDAAIVAWHRARRSLRAAARRATS